MSQYIEYFNNIQKLKLYFVNEQFMLIIKTTVTNFFPKLDKDDQNILIILTTFIIDIISMKYGFKTNNNIYYEQWTQNNNRDIKGVILLLLPFIKKQILYCF